MRQVYLSSDVYTHVHDTSNLLNRVPPRSREATRLSALCQVAGANGTVSREPDVTNLKPVPQLISGTDADCKRSGTSQRLVSQLSYSIWCLLPWWVLLSTVLGAAAAHKKNVWPREVLRCIQS